LGYLERVLQPGESVRYETRISWTTYFPGLIVVLVAAIVCVYGRTALDRSYWTDFAAIILAAIALVLLWRAWFERWTTEIAITDRRIILKTGFIRRDTIEMSVDKVESVDVRQSIFGRLLNFGDIIVRGTGAGFAPLRNIDNPLEFRSHVTADAGGRSAASE
jgi:uncharacterized membrane protein YdbT with pleckstrin-like domain